jgi:hypothetical protein
MGRSVRAEAREAPRFPFRRNRQRLRQWFELRIPRRPLGCGLLVRRVPLRLHREAVLFERIARSAVRVFDSHRQVKVGELEVARRVHLCPHAHRVTVGRPKVHCTCGRCTECILCCMPAVCAGGGRPCTDYRVRHTSHGVRTHAVTTPTRRGDLLWIHQWGTPARFRASSRGECTRACARTRSRARSACRSGRLLSSMSTTASTARYWSEPCTTSRHCATDTPGTASSARIRRRACDVHECATTKQPTYVYRGTGHYRRKTNGNTCEHITSAP